MGRQSGIVAVEAGEIAVAVGGGAEGIAFEVDEAGREYVAAEAWGCECAW